MASVYIDNDVAAEVAALLRGAGHQAVTTGEVGLARAMDTAQLLTAAQRGRSFVTHNAKDFVLLHDGWRRWSEAWGVSEQHAGILILPQATAAERALGRMNPIELAQFLIDLFATGAPRANELWQWRRGRGWVLEP
jgi:hypothetical protein